jgi:hypothetical protein
MVGLPEAIWSNVEEEKNKNEEYDKSHLHGNSIQHDSKQSALSDFMT